MGLSLFLKPSSSSREPSLVTMTSMLGLSLGNPGESTGLGRMKAHKMAAQTKTAEKMVKSN